MVEIDILYLKEAKRIRMTYLDNIGYIVLKEEEIQKYLNKLNDISKELDKDNVDQQYYKKLMDDINYNVDKLKNYIDHYYNNIKNLDEDQRKLYYNIKDKYNDITDEDMRIQIMKYLELTEKEFIMKNPELYNKLKENKNKF